MLLSVNIPTTDVRRSERFYKYLVKGKLGEHPQNKGALFMTVDNCAVTIFPKHPQEQMTCYFEVSDLDKAIAELSDLGGNLIVQPFTVATPTGQKKAAVLSDPDGNGVGIVA